MEKVALPSNKRTNKRSTPFDAEAFLSLVNGGKTVLKTVKGQTLFSQGDDSDAVFYLLTGKIKLVVVSPQGKEAVIAVLDPGTFFGEACLTTQTIRIATATAMEEVTVVRINKASMLRVLHDEPAFSELFLSYLLTRNIRIEADLVDQLFNSSEKRLARVLLLLAHFGKESKTERIIPKISQETLADMVGTTRSRVSFFMNKFKKLGFIDTEDGLHIHSSLLNIVLYD